MLKIISLKTKPIDLLGLKGDDGQRGHRGDNGTLGQEGPVGDDGRNGTSGVQGFQGPKGEKGELGNDGPDGNNGLIIITLRFLYQYIIIQFRNILIMCLIFHFLSYSNCINCSSERT